MSSIDHPWADRLCGARKQSAHGKREKTRWRAYDGGISQIKADRATLSVPKLRRLSFETAIIDRYRRRESSVEETLIEMYLVGVSGRRVEDIRPALGSTRVSASIFSSSAAIANGRCLRFGSRISVVAAAMPGIRCRTFTSTSEQLPKQCHSLGGQTKRVSPLCRPLISCSPPIR